MARSWGESHHAAGSSGQRRPVHDRAERPEAATHLDAHELLEQADDHLELALLAAADLVDCRGRGCTDQGGEPSQSSPVSPGPSGPPAPRRQRRHAPSSAMSSSAGVGCWVVRRLDIGSLVVVVGGSSKGEEGREDRRRRRRASIMGCAVTRGGHAEVYGQRVAAPAPAADRSAPAASINDQLGSSRDVAACSRQDGQKRRSGPAALAALGRGGAGGRCLGRARRSPIPGQSPPAWAHSGLRPPTARPRSSATSARCHHSRRSTSTEAVALPPPSLDHAFGPDLAHRAPRAVVRWRTRVSPGCRGPAH